MKNINNFPMDTFWYIDCSNMIVRKESGDMKKLRILCDADDTIQELTIHWLAELNNKYNCNVRKEDIKTWDMTKAFPGLSEEEVLEPLYRNDFWSITTPIEGSRYYLKQLIDDGHDVLIVTASNPQTFEAKRRKLIEMFPFLTADQIICENNKQSVRGDILIDDGVHNLLGGTYQKFLFNQPNNLTFDEKLYDITRVYSWKEIYERISSMVA